MKGMANTIFLDGGPQALGVAPASCFIGAGNEMVQTYVPRITGQGAYDLARFFGASEEASEIFKQSTEGMTSIFLDTLRKPPVLNASHLDTEQRRSSTLLAQDYFTSHPSVESLGKLGNVRFRGVEVGAVRDLSHLPNERVEAMARRGVAPYDLHGRPLQLHHIGQEDHRMPNSKLVMIPNVYHKINNPRQHPLNNHSGIGKEARKDFPKFRRAFYKELGRQELLNRELNHK
jgi:hypothetical protein